MVGWISGMVRLHANMLLAIIVWNFSALYFGKGLYFSILNTYTDAGVGDIKLIFSVHSSIMFLM